MSLTHQLIARNDPIQAGLIGAGIFGSQVLYAAEETPGMEIAAIADLDTDIARDAFIRAGVSESKLAECMNQPDLMETIRTDNRAIVTNGSLLTHSKLDVIIDATGIPNVAARHAYESLLNNTHFVNVSVEADTAVGPLLATLADANDATYSLAFGDQPAQIVELCDWARATGLEIVAAGRTAGGMDPYGTPDDALDRHGWIDSFRGTHDPDPQIYNSFLDGTKIAVESCSAANALNLSIDRPGMHKPSLQVEDIPKRLCPDSAGGLLTQRGVVDAIEPETGPVSVFAVTTTSNPHRTAYYPGRSGVYTAADGEYQAFTRPFHMAPETTVSIARTVLRNEPTGTPRSHQAEVVGRAKRPLEPGETLDGGGGYTAYGEVVPADFAATNNYIPLELLEDATVTNPIDPDDYISYDDVQTTDSFIVALRRLQEDLVTESTNH